MTDTNRPYLYNGQLQTDAGVSSGVVVKKRVVLTAAHALFNDSTREWVTDALAKIAPTFRFGPVLVDPKHIRMPIAAELNGTWTWDHRTDVITWASDPVTHATQDALLQFRDELLRDGEVHAHRIDLEDTGEWPGRRADQVSLLRLGEPRHAVNRGADRGEPEIQLGVFDGGSCLGDLPVSHLVGLRPEHQNEPAAVSEDATNLPQVC